MLSGAHTSYILMTAFIGALGGLVMLCLTIFCAREAVLARAKGKPKDAIFFLVYATILAAPPTVLAVIAITGQ